MRTKFKLATACMVAGALLLTGCGAGGSASSKSSSGAESKKAPVTIKYISSTILESPEKEFEQSAIDEFNAQKNGVTVEVEGVAANDLMQKYTALATANQMPDFYMADMKNTTQLVDMGITDDMTKILDKKYLSQFGKDTLDGFTIDGKLSGLPWFTVAQGVVYRKDLFEKDKVQVPKTWDEFVAAAHKLTHGDQYGIALVGSKDASGAGRFQYVIRNFGVDEFKKGSDGKWSTDIGGPNYVKALKSFTDLDTKEKVCPPGVTETNYASAVNILSSGQAAMLITGSNAVGAITSKVPDLKGKLGSFMIPTVKRNVFSQNGFGFYVNPKSSNKEAVAKFLKFMVSKKKSIEFSQLTGRLPTIATAQKDPSIGKDPALSGFMEQLNKAKTFNLPTIEGYGEVNDIHGEAYQSVITGSATPEAAAAKAKTRAQAIVDEANQK
ncbi:sugar ABC transporter substrate-binding protein [Bifidobacterium sp. ESL0732]|uniref:ABC transporter substrate-binding protein n=1 Tax=Bifidobacterium sp. ESL0732 TaxID=2983222 RepID=UPI0023F7222E|nr:sugar ABC transporter substrate-binding protein [Bifidobacterium sp. ESL0732]WEV63912.1 sugar ABC transporter substrate-binding protein [Bifidobacterium sp. ESL0732]